MQLNTSIGEISYSTKIPIKDFSTVDYVPSTGYLLCLESVNTNRGLKISIDDFEESLLKPSTSLEENLLTYTDSGLFVPDKTGDLASLETEHKSDIVSAMNEIYDGTVNKIQNLQNQIDTLVASSDVKDIVGTYQDLINYDKSKLGNNDIIKVLRDEVRNNQRSYYRWRIVSESYQTWAYIGSDTDIISIKTLESMYNTLVDNSIYKIVQTGSLHFYLPVVTDTTTLHQIMVQLTANGDSINLGLGDNPKYFNQKLPIINEGVTYNIYYEYDIHLSSWVCGFLSKGVVVS